MEKIDYNIKSFTDALLLEDKYPLLNHFQVFKNQKLVDNILQELLLYK